LVNTNPINIEKGPFISCIINFYNTNEIFFREAIESVLAQTYKNWELLLVDDGSTNLSTDIALEYVQKNPLKIRYLEHENHQNRGSSAARNLGIEYARGEFIAFLDSDDIWFSHKLAQQLEIMKNNPRASMVYGKTLYWQSWTGVEQDAQYDYIPDLGVETNQLHEPPKLILLCYPLGKYTAPSVSGILLRRETIAEIGGFEIDFKGMYDDQVFFSKLYLRFPVFVADKLWDKYRLHPDSCCARAAKEGQYHSVRQDYLNWLERYLSQQNVQDKTIWKKLSKAQFAYRHPRLKYLSNIPLILKRRAKNVLKSLLWKRLPHSLQLKVKHQMLGKVKFGNLRRVTPVCREFGSKRGYPVDRFYIENFLAEHKADVQGRVLEIGDATYTRRFGEERVRQSDVLHVVEGNPEATIIGDLTNADHIPSNVFDCIIITQTLQLIYDLRSALTTLYRILKPGGVLLATVPGISQVVKCNWGDNWYWAFTDQSARLLFEEFFDSNDLEVRNHGNVLAAISFLHGITQEELTREELLYQDDEYQVIIAIRVCKPQTEL